jgi:hypothetical protein
MNARVASRQFAQADVSKDLSQLIRSNTPQYWRYMKHKADLSSLKRYLPFEGVIAGDPHLGNFSVLPLKSVGSPRQMRFVDVDFDDAGCGPFVLDFVRYLIASKSIYVAGLAEKARKPPKKLRALLAMPVSKYDDMAAQYVNKNSSKSGFKLKKDEIERYTAKIPRVAIESLFPTEKVIDLAIRHEARGGSAKELRIWVLVENRNSRRIIELKEYAEPAIANYRAQPPVRQWLKEVRETFWPGLDGSAYDLIDVPGGGPYWVRDKHVSLIDVPYSSGKRKNTAFVDALAVYDANVLGLAHGRQAKAARYRALIEKDPEAFHDAVKPVVKSYLELARANFHDK